MGELKEIQLDKLLSMVRDEQSRSEAFSELASRYKPLISKKVLSLVGDGADSLEATQEAHLALLSAALTYDGERCEGVTFGLYASVCIVNMLRSYLRTRRRVSERSETVESDKLYVRQDVEGFLSRKELCERVMRIASGVLSAFELSVFKLQLEGYPTREIAARLDRTAKSIDNAKNRISARLRGNSEICRILSDEF